MNAHHDHEFDRINAALDRLAESERAAAPASLESNVYRASRAALRSGGAPRPRIGWGLGLRLAAAAALLAGTIGVISTLNRAGPQPAPAANVTAAAFETWLALDDLFDDGFGTRLGVVSTDADRLSQPDTEEWDDMEGSL
ncbi:MAG TPA: hypothetical protein PLU35_08565 [Phycisphaerales bacterium]|nr:hypothetical protein [Phycisphaerales bacterium]